jgi:hypothetical protein
MNLFTCKFNDRNECSLIVKEQFSWIFFSFFLNWETLRLKHFIKVIKEIQKKKYVKQWNSKYILECLVWRSVQVYKDFSFLISE